MSFFGGLRDLFLKSLTWLKLPSIVFIALVLYIALAWQLKPSSPTKNPGDLGWKLGDNAGAARREARFQRSPPSSLVNVFCGLGFRVLGRAGMGWLELGTAVPCSEDLEGLDATWILFTTRILSGGSRV